MKLRAMNACVVAIGGNPKAIMFLACAPNARATCLMFQKIKEGKPMIPIIDVEFQSLIPPLTKEEYVGLEASILKEGCRDALVLWKETLVDGHNRLAICQKHNLSYETKLVKFDDRDTAKIWILNNQLARRNLTLYQRAEIGLALEDIIKAQAKERQREGGLIKVPQNSAEAGETRDKLAKAAGVSHDTMARVKKIAEQAPEDVKAKLRTGEVSINQAYNEIKKAERREKIQQLSLSDSPMPYGEFDIIYADPPWQYEHIVSKSRAIENQYPTLTLEDIKALSVPVKENAVLFLWATAPKLDEALQVMKAWQFDYRTCAIWDKEVIGMGYWFRNQHELLLVGVKGVVSPPPENKRISSVFRSKREGHSQKPDFIYSIIENMFPNYLYLELFARNERPGWKSWGNEL